MVRDAELVRRMADRGPRPDQGQLERACDEMSLPRVVGARAEGLVHAARRERAGRTAEGLSRRAQDALLALARNLGKRLTKREVADQAVEGGCHAAHPGAWISSGLKELRDLDLAESTHDGVAITRLGVDVVRVLTVQTRP